MAFLTQLQRLGEKKYRIIYGCIVADYAEIKWGMINRHIETVAETSIPKYCYQYKHVAVTGTSDIIIFSLYELTVL